MHARGLKKVNLQEIKKKISTRNNEAKLGRMKKKEDDPVVYLIFFFFFFCYVFFIGSIFSDELRTQKTAHGYQLMNKVSKVSLTSC